MSRWTPGRLGEIYRRACALDVQVFKPGNVSLQSPGHGMCADDFLRSAEHSAPAIAGSGLGLGQRILDAVTATRRAVGCNTNLGIVLLAAPLMQASLAYPQLTLRAGVERCLADTTLEDADLVYRAIALARPGGLGALVEHDVHTRARLPLVAAMRQAADRDLIARQYADGFADLFDRFEPYLSDAIARGGSVERGLSDLFLYLLTRYPDTHIQRKHGAAVAGRVARMASRTHREYLSAASTTAADAALRVLDAKLKAAGLNPGTSADMCVAGLISYRLKEQAGQNTGATRENPRIRRPDRAELRHPINSL